MKQKENIHMYTLELNKQYKKDHKETRNFKQLKETLVKGSISKTFDDALNEWAEIDRYYVSNDGHQCICGKPHIHELCIIKNILTGIKLTVGNCCIDYFWNTDSKLFFRSLAKISNDRASSANKALINFARKQKIFDNWEYVFYSDIWRKHNKSLSPKQLAKKQYLNEKLLEAFKVSNIHEGLR